MGYGEAGGGGSVQWQVLYDDATAATPPANNPTGKPRRGFGKDNGAGTSAGDKLYVVCTEAQVLQQLPAGVVVVEVTLMKKKDNQVVLLWGNDVPDELRDRSVELQAVRAHLKVLSDQAAR
jgi:hypothetical protein